MIMSFPLMYSGANLYQLIVFLFTVLPASAPCSSQTKSHPLPYDLTLEIMCLTFNNQQTGQFYKHFKYPSMIQFLTQT